MIASGVDVRANGGYVCWPPAGGYQAVYRLALAEVPGWLLPALVRPAPKVERPALSGAHLPDQSRRYGAFVSRLLGNIATAPDGAKHYALLRNGRTLGGVTAAAGLTECQAIDLLLDALPDTVLDWAAARKTAAWAVAKGMAEPFQLADRPYGSR